MRCPHCEKSTLETFQVKGSGVRLDRCNGCSGVWYDSDELQQVMSVAEEKLHMLDKAHPSQRLCPLCLREMFVFDYPQTDVAVDMCGHCRGLWLDLHEAERIKTARKQWMQQQDAERSNSAKSPLTNILEAVFHSLDFLPAN
ncbi:MAG: zf-TFIIB domain-containing protein [Planctomycetaceae bacterium]|nr:zf-TFIIB domain-containing protein [Planctomycetaceae bacterium]